MQINTCTLLLFLKIILIANKYLLQLYCLVIQPTWRPKSNTAVPGYRHPPSARPPGVFTTGTLNRQQRSNTAARLSRPHRWSLTKERRCNRFSFQACAKNSKDLKKQKHPRSFQRQIQKMISSARASARRLPREAGIRKAPILNYIG